MGQEHGKQFSLLPPVFFPAQSMAPFLHCEQMTPKCFADFLQGQDQPTWENTPKLLNELWPTSAIQNKEKAIIKFLERFPIHTSDKNEGWYHWETVAICGTLSYHSVYHGCLYIYSCIYSLHLLKLFNAALNHQASPRPCDVGNACVCYPTTVLQGWLLNYPLML